MTRTDIGLGMSGKETRSCHCRARARRLSYVRARRRVLSAIKTRPTEQPDTVLACPVPAVADWGSLVTVSREETGGIICKYYGIIMNRKIGLLYEKRGTFFPS